MSPSPEHELWKTNIARLVELFAHLRRVDLRGYGSTTFKKEARERGAEPDEFYLVGERLADFPEIVLEACTRPRCSRSSTSTPRSACRRSGSSAAGLHRSLVRRGDGLPDPTRQRARARARSRPRRPVRHARGHPAGPARVRAGHRRTLTPRCTRARGSATGLRAHRLARPCRRLAIPIRPRLQ
jgi:hypothetical protein